jgi:hypothetical protein
MCTALVERGQMALLDMTLPADSQLQILRSKQLQLI